MWRILIVFAILVIRPAQSAAINRSWDDGGSGDNWNLTNNWSPNGNPGGDDLFIGDLPQGAGEQTIVNFDFNIESLTVTNGASVDTDGNLLTISGPASFSGVNSVLRLREADSGLAGLTTESLTVGVNGRVDMHNDSAMIIGNGVLTNLGTIQGNGAIRLFDNPPTVTSLLINTGTLSVGSPGVLFNTIPRTLQITALGSNARVDLDGNGTGVVNLQANTTLDLDVPLAEAFSGDLNFTVDTILDVADAWQLDGNINVNTSFLGSVGEATITGGLLGLDTGTTITLNNSDEVLRFAAPLLAGGGSTIANSGTIIFDADAQFGEAADFQMNGNFASMVVNSQVTIESAIDIDGGGSENNVVTINETGRLIVSNSSERRVDNVININGGELRYDGNLRADFDGVINMHAEADQVARLELISPFALGPLFPIGDEQGTADAFLNVSGEGISQVNMSDTQSFWVWGDGVIDIEAGATLEINGSMVATTGAQVSGAGTLRMGRINARNSFGTAIYDVDNVDLDHFISSTGEAHRIETSVTINANSIEQDDGGFGGDMIITYAPSAPTNANGRLTMNVPGGWQFDSGIISLTNDEVGHLPVMLVGERMTMGSGSRMNVSGEVVVRAPLTIGGTITTTSSLSTLFLGQDAFDPPIAQRIEGGTVSGRGKFTLFNTPLSGFGAISTSLESNDAVMADDGVLSLTDAIPEAEVLGVTDDGILHYTNGWSNVGIADSVVLEGGEIRGGDLLNADGKLIRGHGLISAQIQNEGTTRAEGGTLTLDPSDGNSDYDGLGNAGSLAAATSATLILRNASGTSQIFQGTISVGNSAEIFTDGLRLQHSSSTIVLTNNSVYRTNRGANFNGTLQSFATASSSANRIVNETYNGGSSLGFVTFDPSADIQLINSGPLELDGLGIRIEAGATFSGNGSLRLMPDAALGLRNQVDIGVPIINEGVLALFDNSTTAETATIAGLTQTSTGTLQIDISGVAPGLFDLLTVTNNAQLDGTLNVDLFNNFEPLLGNSFTILETSFGNIGGTFAVEALPIFNGLTFDVVYNPQSVVLEVIEATSADVDQDGDVDGADFLAIQRDSPALIPLWELQYGTSAPVGATQTVPEPSSFLMLLGLGILLISARPMNPGRPAEARHLARKTLAPAL